MACFPCLISVGYATRTWTSPESKLLCIPQWHRRIGSEGSIRLASIHKDQFQPVPIIHNLIAMSCVFPPRRSRLAGQSSKGFKAQEHLLDVDILQDQQKSCEYLAKPSCERLANPQARGKVKALARWDVRKGGNILRFQRPSNIQFLKLLAILKLYNGYATPGLIRRNP